MALVCIRSYLQFLSPSLSLSLPGTDLRRLTEAEEACYKALSQRGLGTVPSTGYSEHSTGTAASARGWSNLVRAWLLVDFLSSCYDS